MTGRDESPVLLVWDRGERVGPFTFGRDIPSWVREMYAFRYRELTSWRDRPTTRFTSEVLGVEIGLAGGVFGALGSHVSFVVDGVELIGVPLGRAAATLGVPSSSNEMTFDDVVDEEDSVPDDGSDFSIFATQDWDLGRYAVHVIATDEAERGVLRITVAGVRDRGVIPDQTPTEEARLSGLTRRSFVMDEVYEELRLAGDTGVEPD